MPTTEIEKHVYDRVGGAVSLDFANTLSNYVDKQTPTYDYLDSYIELFNFARQMEIITPAQEKKLTASAKANPQLATALVTKAKNLRTAIRHTLTAAGEGRAPEPEALATFNSELAEAMSHARIIEGNGTYQWSFQPSSNLESILWPIIKSAADLLVSDKIARVHECAGDTCGWMFLDTSKNHSRRWCDMKDCGNNVKARRFYNKVRKQTEAEEN